MFRSSFASLSIFVVLALSAVGLGGCAVNGSEDNGNEETDVSSIATTPAEGIVAPQMMGYVPRVTRADLRAAGASCAGNLCTLSGRSWDCTGGGLCSQIAR